MTEKSESTERDWSKFDTHVITEEEYEELPELDDEFFECADLYEGNKLIRAGRPVSASRKVLLTVRYDSEVLEAFRATGRGWQTRMNEALKEWLKEHAA
jgi:uncharacterized protein (DUF4415 family)